MISLPDRTTTSRERMVPDQRLREFINMLIEHREKPEKGLAHRIIRMADAVSRDLAVEREDRRWLQLTLEDLEERARHEQEENPWSSQGWAEAEEWIKQNKHGMPK